MPICVEPVAEICVNEVIYKKYDGVADGTINDYPVYEGGVWMKCGYVL